MESSTELDPRNNTSRASELYAELIKLIELSITHNTIGLWYSQGKLPTESILVRLAGKDRNWPEPCCSSKRTSEPTDLFQWST